MIYINIVILISYLQSSLHILSNISVLYAFNYLEYGPIGKKITHTHHFIDEIHKFTLMLQ